MFYALLYFNHLSKIMDVKIFSIFSIIIVVLAVTKMKINDPQLHLFMLYYYYPFKVSQKQ